MKAAVCFSGQTRKFSECLGHLKEYIIDPLEADVFIHTWESSVDLDFIEVISEPKAMLAEKQIQFFDERYKHRAPSNYNVFNVLSQWYSAWKVNELKLEHERENRFKYDLVVRCRMDLLPLTKLNFYSHDLNCLWVPDMYMKWRNHGAVEDQFAFSSSENMDIYFNFYNHIDEIFDKTTVRFNSEELLTLYLMGKRVDGNTAIKISEPRLEIGICSFDYRLIR